VIVPAGYYSHYSTSDDDGNDMMYIDQSTETSIIIDYFIESDFKVESDFDNNGNNNISDNNDHNDNIRDSILICPKGSYCLGGMDNGTGTAIKCPPGTHNSLKGITTLQSCLDCPMGFYCPLGSIDPFKYPCGNSTTWYCPVGSSHRIRVEEGFYVTLPILFTSEISLFTTSVIAGYGNTEICPMGYFCINGIKYPCSAGRYGSIERSTNHSCSGICTAGWYCPDASITARQNICSNSATYCPIGSGYPINVKPGYYTYSFVEDNDTTISDVDYQNIAYYTNEKLCEPGFYCLHTGIRYKCPSGRFGNSSGMTNSSCSGSCESGYFCHKGSINSTEYACGHITRYCPAGSNLPRIVSKGYYTISGTDHFDDNFGSINTRSSERICSPGYYCVNGTQIICPAGYYGSKYGEYNSLCEGLCENGYYCPEGSISSKEVKCGDASKYCPQGSILPLHVNEGYYSIGGTYATRFNQVISPIGHFAIGGIKYTCPEGYYGSDEGMSSSDCSGPCLIDGFYCPSGSISPYMKICGGDNMYCPKGISTPLFVRVGFYTGDYRYELCPAGKYKTFKSQWNDPSQYNYSYIITEVDEPHCELCPSGKYKSTVGDNVNFCKDCPLYSSSIDTRMICQCDEKVSLGYHKYFNISTGICTTLLDTSFDSITMEMWSMNNTNSSLTRYQEYECEPGHYCNNGLRYRCPSGYYGSLRREINSTCEGLCHEGYYCLNGSTSAFANPCGGSDRFCPIGTIFPIIVPKGYYSNEDGNELLRSSMSICPFGYYCPGDGRRYLCQNGYYGGQLGLYTSTCSGPCDEGYFCIEGSDNAKQYKCGNSTVYCPHGSSYPMVVTEGFYSDFSGDDAGAKRLWDSLNETCSVEILCEPGYFCQNGKKYPCPPGTFGWKYGVTSNECGGKCAAGYYCPSYLEHQLDAPGHTIWPGAPHTTATPYECGGVSFLCPKGSFYPVLVGGGNYTVGGGTNNMTRTGQNICLAGTFCTDGIVNLCPKGRYGAYAGQSVSTCTGWCPAGHYCPAGTSEPLPCPEGYYATGAAWACSQCPGQRSTPLLCNTARECCFRG
jgi:hypothetical protein